jgi:hypothetical protein
MRRILFGLALVLTAMPACAQTHEKTYFTDTACLTDCYQNTSPNTSSRAGCALLCARVCPATPGFVGPHGESCVITSRNIDALRDFIDVCKQLEALNEPCEAGRPSTHTDNKLIFPDSDRRLLRVAEVQGLSSYQLRIARNEIYARRGRYFKDEALTAHFSQFSWYQPNRWDVTLNNVERANVKLIQSMEK